MNKKDLINEMYGLLERIHLNDNDSHFLALTTKTRLRFGFIISDYENKTGIKQIYPRCNLNKLESIKDLKIFFKSRYSKHILSNMYEYLDKTLRQLIDENLENCIGNQ